MSVRAHWGTKLPVERPADVVGPFLVKTVRRPWTASMTVRHLLDRFPCAEIYLLDDGKDGEWAWQVRPWLARRCHCLTLPYDSGLSAGRNALCRRARRDGHTVAFLMDDDHVVETGRSRGLVRALAEARQGALFTAVRILGRSVPRTFEVVGRDLLGYARPLHTSRHDEDGVWRCNLVPNCGAVNLDAVLSLDGGWDPRLKLGEHWDFFYRGWLAGASVSLVVNSHMGHRSHRNDRRAGNGAAYRKLRRRAHRFSEQARRRHGIRRLRQYAH